MVTESGPAVELDDTILDASTSSWNLRRIFDLARELMCRPAMRGEFARSRKSEDRQSGCTDLALGLAHPLLTLFKHFAAEVLLSADMVRGRLQENGISLQMYAEYSHVAFVRGPSYPLYTAYLLAYTRTSRA